MRIPVRLQKDSYDIILERGSLAHAAELLGLHGKVLIVTDEGVPSPYAATVAAQCPQSFIECLPQGEASKGMAGFERLLRAMLEHGFGRSDCVVAVGGGMVGDLGGFAAACYMRGVDFYNIPTTVLSQVDSSIGGKTAIDLAGVKNIVGAFYQPKGVLIDPDVLRTLSPRLRHEGMAEVIKMALTSDASLFELLETASESEELLETVIGRALRIKADVVEQDPNEKGLRRVLNFGHTLGHAVEGLYEGSLLHGECVSIGMLPMCAEPLRGRVEKLLTRYELPTHSSDTAEALLPFFKHDKKKNANGITAVLVEQPGSFEFRSMTAEELCCRWEESR